MYTRQLFVKNGLFLAAVAGVFASCQQQGNNKATASANDSSVTQPASGSVQRLAFVDIDSLEAHYDYFKEKKTALEKDKETAQNDLTARDRALQNELRVLQQKAPTMTQAEGEAAQMGLQQKGQQFEQYRQTLYAQIQTKEAQFNEDLQKRLDEGIKKFNSDNRFAFIFSYRSGASNILYKDEAFNVTKEVIKELNAAPKK